MENNTIIIEATGKNILKISNNKLYSLKSTPYDNPINIIGIDTNPINIANTTIIETDELDFFCLDFLVVKSVNPFLKNIFVKYNAVLII